MKSSLFLVAALALAGPAFAAMPATPSPMRPIWASGLPGKRTASIRSSRTTLKSPTRSTFRCATRSPKSVVPTRSKPPASIRVHAARRWRLPISCGSRRCWPRSDPVDEKDYVSAQSRSGRNRGVSMRTVFWRELSPRNSVTARCGTPNARARKRTSSALALPSTGGAARRTLRASP